MAGEFGEAGFVKRALGALWFMDGWRGGLGFKELVEGGDGGLGGGPKFGSELDFAAALAACVKDRARGNVEVIHLLKAKGLSAELGIIVVKLAAFAFFVFDRIKPQNGVR